MVLNELLDPLVDFGILIALRSSLIDDTLEEILISDSLHSLLLSASEEFVENKSCNKGASCCNTKFN